MEHHSYAKSGNKKWSVEEKRELVERRIAADELFAKYSPKHAEPWKKFKDMAKIGDFSEHALRKQWLSMVQSYRIQKANFPSGPLNRQSIEELNQEWEFFGLIHAYMNQKTTEMHSYALKEPNVGPPNNNLAIANVFSCDGGKLSPLMLGVLNDHNFGEPSAAEIRTTAESDDLDEASQCLRNEELDRLLAEATQSQDTRNGDDAMLHTLATGHYDEVECGPVMIGGEVSLSNSRYNDFHASLPLKKSGKIEERSAPSSHRSANRQRSRKVLSEKDKYYRHRRRYEQRMEKRFMGLCTVVGQLLQQLAPNVDVQPLLALGKDTLNAISSSDENDEDTSVC